MLTDDEILSVVRPGSTMTPSPRVRNLLRRVETVVSRGIPGDLVEVGAWRGGMVAAMVLKLAAMGASRTVRGYDTFRGMTPPGEHDVNFLGERADLSKPDTACVCDLETARNTVLNALRIAARHCPGAEITVKLHEGDVRETTVFPDEIALLRLDTDWYELTRYNLEHFEPLVAEGGHVIVDDYGHWRGCRRAVDEFERAGGLRGAVKTWTDYSEVSWEKK